MDDSNEGKVYLNRKEKLMLNLLLKNGRTFNTNIANKLKISSQATGRIRRMLEKQGVVKKYSIELNNEFFGINVFVLVLFNIRKSFENLVMTDNLINLYKVIANSITHIALYGFKDLKESDNFLSSLIQHSPDVKIVESYIFPREGIIKQSSQNLFFNALSGFEGKIMKFYRGNNDDKKEKDLTYSEKRVLKSLILNPIISCKKIANEKEIKTTRTGVNRIKDRLERRGIIKRYCVDLDYEKLGVNVLAFIFVTPNAELIKSAEEYIRKCKDSNHVIGCYRLNEESALFCGFRNLNELENYFNILSTDYKDLLKINHIHIISPRGVIKESCSDLYLSLLK